MMSDINTGSNRRIRRISSILLSFALIFSSTVVVFPLQASAATVRIGQAASGENGKIRNCKAGDQSGGEVSIVGWSYSSKYGAYNNWRYVFRCKSPSKAKKLAKLMKDACNNNKIGYDQKGGDRDTLYDEAKKKNWDISAITKKCETTCASVVTVCLNGVGIKTPRYWDSSLVYKDLKATGKFTIFKDKAHTASTRLLEPGDILLSPGVHTVMVVESTNAAGSEDISQYYNAESELCAVSIRQPSTIAKGNGFSIAGYVESNYDIKKVTISIVDENGKAVIKKSAKPYEMSYRLGNLDAAVKFGTLDVGQYTYRITAEDEKKGPITVHENKFTVVDEMPEDATVQGSDLSSLSLDKSKLPSSLTQYVDFSIKGTITSNKKITSVKAVVTTKSGKTKLTASAKPNAKSYSISKLNSALKFDNLGAGTYKFILTASDKAQTLVLAYNTFTVAAAEKPASIKSAMSISNTRTPSKIKKGNKFSFWGKIKSSSKITAVSIKVINSAGKTKLSASAKPKKKTYQIKKLDKKIKFAKLKKGKYTFQVRAKNSSGWKTLIKKRFVVK